MSVQGSKKSGLRSSAQKEQRARNDYEKVPPSNPVHGAFGKQNAGSTGTRRQTSSPRGGKKK